jgi:hypothetical protein
MHHRQLTPSTRGWYGEITCSVILLVLSAGMAAAGGALELA